MGGCASTPRVLKDGDDDGADAVANSSLPPLPRKRDKAAAKIRKLVKKTSAKMEGGFVGDEDNNNNNNSISRRRSLSRKFKEAVKKATTKTEGGFLADDAAARRPRSFSTQLEVRIYSSMHIYLLILVSLIYLLVKKKTQTLQIYLYL